jgi:hypothetical protein
MNIWGGVTRNQRLPFRLYRGAGLGRREGLNAVVWAFLGDGLVLTQTVRRPRDGEGPIGFVWVILRGSHACLIRAQ